MFLVPPWFLFQQKFQPLASVQEITKDLISLSWHYGGKSVLLTPCSPDSLFRTKALRRVTLHGHYTAERDRPCEKMMDSLSAATRDAPIFHTSNFIISTRIHKLYLRPPYQDRPQESSRNCHISKVLNPSLLHQVAVWVLYGKPAAALQSQTRVTSVFGLHVRVWQYTFEHEFNNTANFVPRQMYVFNGSSY